MLPGKFVFTTSKVHGINLSTNLGWWMVMFCSAAFKGFRIDLNSEQRDPSCTKALVDLTLLMKWSLLRPCPNWLQVRDIYVQISSFGLYKLKPYAKFQLFHHVFVYTVVSHCICRCWKTLHILRRPLHMGAHSSKHGAIKCIVFFIAKIFTIKT